MTAGYRAGTTERTERRSMLAVAGALVVGVVVLAWPFLLAVLVAGAAVRCHRRWRSWRRTAACALSWASGIALGALAIDAGTQWPLAGVALVCATWAIGPRRLRIAAPALTRPSPRAQAGGGPAGAKIPRGRPHGGPPAAHPSERAQSVRQTMPPDSEGAVCWGNGGRHT